jgi:hypothetical protein
MSSPTSSKLVLPGPEDWSHYRRGSQRGEWVRATARDKSAVDPETWISIPSLQFEFLFARLPAGSPAERQEMLKLEMESRGWQPDGRDQGRIAWLTTEEDGHVLCSAACWPGQPSLDEFSRAGSFSPSAWCYGYRPYSVTIWREAGRLTAVWCGATANFPLHCQGLSQSALDGDLAGEIRMVELSLRLAGVPVRSSTLVVRGELGDPASRHALARGLGWNEVMEQLIPQDPGFEISRTLVPPTAAAYRKRVRDQARLRGFVLFSLAVMGVGGFFMVQPALAKQKELNARVAAVDQIEPELQRLRSARESWNLLQPALNPNRYPQELLLRCVNEVPNEGVRVTQFESGPNSLLVVGEASTPQEAISFQNRLKVNVKLMGAVWDTPSPAIQGDGRASFQVQAKFEDVPEQP